MLPIGLTDVFATGWLGGGGYGDPLERDLDAIEQDIIEERTSLEHAASVYGAVTDGARVDRERSRIRREELRGARLGSGPVPAPPPARLPEGGRWLDENIVLRPAGHACCARCDQELALPGQNYKLGCQVIETPMAETDRVWVSPSTYVDDADIVFRQFACPGCGTLLETEISLRGLPPLHDKQLHDKLA